ncbi:lactonase family protein [Paenibacillus sp. LHD-117]|uniref:lactonase family protein n=1 Tax=Paenibacillus sp. LHD-117 TaxID=3071412 RepID=UPI0027E088D8|nr:lactonase family protein [Paenibacillus sp. LHD-117]MDQ6421202.1 lactonase family protein [Paenibacillus sp. LHD-117]
MGRSHNGWSNGILYIGSYGETNEPTIHVCRFDKSNGSLDILQKVEGVENASYLALHPNGTKLYAVKEIAEAGGEAGGVIAALDIDAETGLLGRVTSSASTIGEHPCYVSVDADGTAAFAANYTGGSIAVLPISPEGEVGPATALLQHACEPGPVTDRQEKPHAHCIAPMPGTAFVCAVDLGMDAVVTYLYNKEEGTLSLQHECMLPGGYGPRHIVFHPELPVAYVANELASSVTQLYVDREKGVLTKGTTYSSIPSDYDGYNDSADIHLSPDGKFLYSSNRGHQSIAVFQVAEESGELTAIQHIGCGGEQPRNFGITPEGDYLLAANQKSGTVVVFRRDPLSGKLEPTGNELKLPSPVCIRFSN